MEGTSFEAKFSTKIPNERESETMRVEKIREIGKGHYGSVYEVVVSIDGKERKFALKEFRDQTVASAEDNAAAALNNFTIAKKASLKVWETYRLGSDKKSILMSLGHMDDWICVGTNMGSSKLQDFDEQSLLEISNFDEILEGVKKQVEIANNADVKVPADAYFFLVNKRIKGKIDFVIGDLDKVESNIDEKGDRYIKNKSLQRFNINQAQASLVLFIEKNIVDSQLKSDYLQQINNSFNPVTN
jgi:hypothetical protein